MVEDRRRLDPSRGIHLLVNRLNTRGSVRNGQQPSPRLFAAGSTRMIELKIKWLNEIRSSYKQSKIEQGVVWKRERWW